MINHILHKLRSASMGLVLVLSLFMPALTWADSFPEYVTNIRLIGGTKDIVDSLKTAYASKGWIIVDVNLNEGVAGSDYVFLVYKKGNRSSTKDGYITDLYLNAFTGDHPNGYLKGVLTINGRKYLRVIAEGNSDFYKYNGHLNAKAGGMDIHLYYTTDNFSNKRAITNITCNYSNTNGQNDKVLYWWNDLNDHPADLNIGVKNSTPIFMHVTTAIKINQPWSDPVMASDLVYNGQPQKLMASEAQIYNGTVYYRVGSGNFTWASNIKATDAGNYTVYYYAAENQFGDASDTLSKNVTIAKSPNSSASVSIASSLYIDDAISPSVTGNLSTGTITYMYSTSKNGTYSTTKPSSAGTYWVYAKIAGDNNCNLYQTAAKQFEIVKHQNNNVTVEIASLVKGDELLKPSVTGNLSMENVTYEYATAENGTYSTTKPSSAGTYWVRATIAENDNYYGYTTAAKSFRLVEWTGNGTETAPYVIGSTEELDLLASRVNGGNTYAGFYFELGADITYVPVDSDNNNEYDNNFTPIGFEDFEFYGKFDGKGHTVSGIVVNADKMGVGLFGNVAGSASIKNLTLANSSFVSNQNNMGGIVGAVWGADVVIENCHVSAGVSVTGATFLGGIVGFNIGTISGSTSEAQVSGVQSVGGIVGNNLGVIENNLYLGTSVSATDKNKVGAIAGYVDRGHPDCKASFTNNYHTLSGMGGVGSANSATGEDVNGARKAVAFSAADGVKLTLVGNPVNYNVSGITAYEKGDKFSNGILYDGKLYAGATENVMLNLGYSVSDGDVLTGYTDGNGNALVANDDGSYKLTMASDAATVTPAIKYLWGEGAKGTAEHPYIISSTEGLDLLAQKVNAGNKYENTYFELGADITYDPENLTIDLDGDGPNLSNYIPIGNDKYYFKGNFDGKGHSISGIVVRSNSDYVGLFGYVIGNIKNLTIANSSFEGNNKVGGILGRVGYKAAIVENCQVSSDVSVMGKSYVGGIVGDNEGQIKGSSSAADVSGKQVVGGIVGENKSNCVIENSLYYGTSVTATDNRYVGAIAGFVGANGSFSNSYHTLKDMGGVGDDNSVTGNDIDNAKFAAPFSVVPAGIGTAETSYGTGDYVGITPYTNGLAYKGRYYYAGTRVGEGYAAVQIFEDAEGKKHAIIDGEYDGPDAVNIEEDIDVTSVTFSREFTPNSGFATIMFPFNVNASSLTGVRSIIEFAGVFDNNGKNAVGMKYVWCNAEQGKIEVDKGHPDCNEPSGELKAYTPYMVEMESATLGIEGKITLKPNSGKTVGDARKGNWVFRGTLQKDEWSNEDDDIKNGQVWTFAASASNGTSIGKFVQFEGQNSVNPFQAYLYNLNGKQLAGTGELGSMDIVILADYIDYTAVQIFRVANGNKHAVIDGSYGASADEPEAVSIPADIEVNSVEMTREFPTGSDNAFSTTVLPFDVNTANVSGLRAVLRYNGIKNGSTISMKVLWAEKGYIKNKDGSDKEYEHAQMTANTPYLVLMKNSEFKLTSDAYPVTLKQTTLANTEIEGCNWVFRGTWKYKKWGSSCSTGKQDCDKETGFAYGFAASASEDNKIDVGTFVKVGEGAWIRPMRAYLVRKDKLQTPRFARANGAYVKRPTVEPEELPELMSIVIDGDGDENETTVIGQFNTRTGEFKMNYDRGKFDLKGRRVNNEKPNARGAYYGKKVLKK